MTVTFGANNIILRKVINKYNGNFSGSTHTINQLHYIRVVIRKNKPLLLPFSAYNKKLLVTLDGKRMVTVQFY